MSYYPEPDSHIRNKVKVVLGLSNYAIVCTPPPPPQNEGGGGATDQIFKEGDCWEKGVTFSGGLSFLHKKKLKSEIINDI